MSYLPTLTNGGGAGSTQSGQTFRQKKEPRSLLEISQNIPSIRNDDGKKLRSRSYDPSSGDETENGTHRKKAKFDRSKSVGDSDKKRNLKRAQEILDKNKAFMISSQNPEVKRKYTDATGNTRHVRFDGNSDEAFGRTVQDGQTGFVTSSPKHFHRATGYGDRTVNAPEDKYNEHNEEGVSPTGTRRHHPQGTHQARLEAARQRARIWAETYSDPGPNAKSIDNEKVIRGQPLDPRRGQGPTDQARAKHAQFMIKGRQDGRPKAAEVGRRLQSLPAKKDQHASQTEDRPANSAPSKEQGQLEGPMPKINTFVSKDNKNTRTQEPQAGSSKKTEPVISSVKPREPAPTKVKEPQTASTKPSEVKTETKVSDAAHNKPKQEDKPKGPETVQKLPEKSPEPARTAFNPAGVAGRSTQDNDHKKPTNKFTTPVRPEVSETSASKNMSHGKTLPSDDHGPVVQPPKPTPSKSDHQTSPNDEDFNYYASEKKKGQNQEETPRIHSEKSSKTDKSWTTIKSKTTDGKPSSYPDSPVKSYTTYNMSSGGQKMENKRREVTIVDPKDAREFRSEEERAEAFLDEYEYSHHHPNRTKDFNEMDDDEKIEYFRDKLHMKPEQIRELTFHPKVTEPKLIHHAYTGVETVNWLAGSAKRVRRPKSKRNVYTKAKTVVSNQRKSVMLTRLQGTMYKQINKVYGASPRDEREKHFFEKLAQLQLDDMQNRYEKLAERERKTLEAKFRQREQLKRLRKKFEDDSWRRFMTQYVTSKVVEAEYRDRQEYGLPNHINQQQSRSTSRRKQQALAPRQLQKKNKQKYSNLFRFNAGPIHKTVGRAPKIEGFDTVYIDTEDEEGKPSRKKQNVDALMREARRILDQSDADETDVEETPRKSRATNYRRPERSYRKRTRDRKHIPDDKSFQSSRTSRSKASKASSRPPPKTMKEMMERRNNAPKPVDRYKASSFAAMKSDLLKDSANLNKNKRLQSSSTATSDIKKPEPEPVVHEMKSETPPPPERTSPQRSQSPVKTKTVTKTTTEVETVVMPNDESADTKPKPSEVSTYLDNMQTQMAIDTARDKPEEPTPQPSRASSKVDIKSEQKVVSRTPSRVSYRNSQTSQDLSSQRDLRPPRAPSRTSVTTTESKNIDAVMKSNKPPQRKFSKSSIMPIDENRPSGSASTSTQNGTNGTVVTKTETVVTKTVTNGVKDNSTNGDKDNKVNIPETKLETGSTITVKQGNRKSSVISVQRRPSRTTSVDITSTNGRMSPTIEHKHESPHRKDSVADKVSIRNMLANGDTKQGSATSSKASRKLVNGSPYARTTVTKNVSTSEQVTETNNEIKLPPKTTQVRKDSQRSNYENEDLLSTRKAPTHDRRSQSFNPNDRTRPTERPSNKKVRAKKESTQRRSRSRTPQRKQVNGHDPSDDFKVDQEQYERLGHDGKRPARNRSGSRDGGGSNRGRKRSTSGGRKKSKTRKRSLSSDRKKSNLKSRFPDIKKKDGEWKILPRSPKQKVSRSENVTEDEYVTERVITPKPANQWQDLVSKYLRQPSPKVGRTEDRSLLDSNMTDDEEDDEMDIFKRAQMRYKLNVDQTDDESDDDY